MQDIGRRRERQRHQRREADGPDDVVEIHGANSPRGRMNINTMKKVKAKT